MRMTLTIDDDVASLLEQFRERRGYLVDANLVSYAPLGGRGRRLRMDVRPRPGRDSVSGDTKVISHV